MEVTGGLKKNWRRRSYQRLDDTGKDSRVMRLGGKRKRIWRIRGLRKLMLRFSFVSPIKLFAKLRDAYVNNRMLGLERKSGATLHADNFFGAKTVAAPNSKKSSSKKVSKAERLEAKMIFELYKSLKASREHELASK